MKAIIKYQALDKTTFNTEEECVRYENLLNKVNKIMSKIGDKVKDKSCEFGNGGGYIQHNKEIVKKAQTDITNLAIKELKLDKDYKFGSFIGRYIDDSGVNCIKEAYCRLQCIDNKGREWGQPYFAINPDKGVQKPFAIK